MNIIKINNKSYKYEFLWRRDKNIMVKDSNGNPLKYPTPCKDKWIQQDLFIKQLYLAQNNLKYDNKFTNLNIDDYKDCLICHKKNITTGLYSVNNIRWENGLEHYIKQHNIKPSNEFIDFIFRYNNNLKNETRVIANIKGVKVVKSKRKKYLKIDRNQLLIMDALLEHGGEKIYKDAKNKKKVRYSEHSGYLDFNHTKLEKIIVSATSTRVESDDNSIFFPEDLPEILDYEYVFHTHPPTGEFGERAKKEGILYEFPSVSDIFHFIDLYNDGLVQGSIVVAPEGLYIIRKKDFDGEKIILSRRQDDELYESYQSEFEMTQNDAIKKYGRVFSKNLFYSKIIKDKYYISRLNEILNQYNIHIDYYNRIKDLKDKWVIPSLKLPVYPIELER